MRDPLARPVSPMRPQPTDCGRPESAPAKEPVQELTVAGLARAFFDPEIRIWRGERPLGMVFWAYGTLATVGFSILYALSLYLGRIGLQQSLLVCITGHTVWIVVSLWRASRPAVNTWWGALVRQLAVVWTVGVILVVAFLQLDLIERYLDALSATACGSPDAVLDAGRCERWRP